MPLMLNLLLLIVIQEPEKKYLIGQKKAIIKRMKMILFPKIPITNL